MNLREALKRTLLLMRDEFGEEITDAELLDALTATRVALVADIANLSSHSAQTAFVTAAVLTARSGHRVRLIAPDIELLAPQPPLAKGRMIKQLLKAGHEILPGFAFGCELPEEAVDLAVAFGNSPVNVKANRILRLNADNWSGSIEDCESGARWRAGDWPLGGMAAAALAAGEAFKISMRKLSGHFRNPSRVETVFADTMKEAFALAPEDTPRTAKLGKFDCVSGGAIINAVLYVLTRVPGVEGVARVIEPETPDHSNLNRYVLLLESHLTVLKTEALSLACANSGISVEPIPFRYEEATLDKILPLSASVIVGVDHIPTRWDVQRADPTWLAIGATTHWSAMASFHEKGGSCAQCLHPYDDPTNAPIPTVAFVSFWAGLLTATYFLRQMAGERISYEDQHIYLSPLRPENPVRGSVARRSGCPTCGAGGHGAKVS